jgi:hypothetical protein
MNTVSAPEVSLFLYLLNCRYEPELLADPMHCFLVRMHTCFDMVYKSHLILLNINVVRKCAKDKILSRVWGVRLTIMTGSS